MFNRTYKLVKHVIKRKMRFLSILKKKTGVFPYRLAAMFLNSYTVNSYNSSQNTLKVIYEIE